MRIGGVVLAGGIGKRMHSCVPKVFHKVLGKPMVWYSIRAMYNVVSPLVVVLGPKGKPFADELSEVLIAIQPEPLGTGDAVKWALPLVKECDGVLVSPGDTPLIRDSSLKKLVELWKERKCAVVVATMVLDNPFGYGRILRDGDRMVGIVEERDATEEQKNIKEVNTGVYLFHTEFLLRRVAELSTDNAQEEYYITDLVRFAVDAGLEVVPLVMKDVTEFLGVNTRKQLCDVERILASRIADGWREKGVTVEEGALIGPVVEVGEDVYVGRGALVLGESKLGKGCKVGAGAFVDDFVVGNGVVIPPGVYLGGGS